MIEYLIEIRNWILETNHIIALLFVIRQVIVFVSC